MCGVVGIVGNGPVNQDIFDALTVLQHRGQDAAGIVTCDEHKLYMRKSNGLVKDVMRTRHMLRLKGRIGIGHVRYPTAGSASEAEAQPFYVNSPYGITLAHNGNLTNADTLIKEIYSSDLRHINTASDSEVLLNVLAHELAQGHKITLDTQDIFNAVSMLHQRCRGAYAAVAVIVGLGMLAFRDPNGIRPLVYGVRESANGKKEYMVASESVALDILGFKRVADVAPGEAIFISHDGKLHIKQCAKQFQITPCLFEFVYLSRPDTFLDKVSVYKVRLRMGEHLADSIKQQLPDHGIDVVMPIPDTGRTSAYPLAKRLGVKFREGFVKNRYIGRTFIMPGQQLRQRSVRQKLNTIDLEFKDKTVLLVDDSIVRGTTCKEIIQMARDAGAKKVYFASTAPAVRYPNVYGIDMPTSRELIAYGRTTAQICKLIGADGLFYQELDKLTEAVQEGNAGITQFDDSVFTGNYITGDIDAAYLTRIEALRNDSAKRELDDSLEDEPTMVGLYNVD